ncbi:protein cup [Anopheles gambiae]|uniref:protein cup n=1 Tax=Anopheles gambiae TaxID=7165 RepID=UPI002AC939AA|nr:protein cup [Anopheles gambiae]
MMKFVNSDTTTKSLRHGEQYENCSEMLIEPDMTSLEELDPAILSCGLPAIVLNAEDSAASASAVPTTTTTTTTRRTLRPSLMASFATVGAGANVIRYTVAHLLALRKSPFAHRRPAAIDEPRTAQYPIWSRTGFNHQPDRVRRVSGGGGGGGGDEDLSGAYGRKGNDRQRDNGYNPPRFRRNHEFSNRNHHVIVKSYSGAAGGDPCAGGGHPLGGGGGVGGAMRLQDTIIEEEPEWVAAGPTSRLDTIELRGFDEDMSRNVAESLKTSPVGVKTRGAFFDELLHYEHVHPKHGGGAKHDLSGGPGDGESVVSHSNNGSPPPARSTPTKGDMNNNSMVGHGAHGRKASGGGSSGAAGCSSSGVNVSNFEELMKFDSILGDSGDSNSSSRFSKYYRRGSGVSAGSSGAGGHHYQHHYPGQQQQQHHHVRFALERNTHHYNNGHQQQQQQQHRQAGSGRLPLSALQHPPAGTGEPFFPGGASSTAPNAGDAKSFQRLLEMLAAQNQRMNQQHQQQYLLQLLQNCQETETLRQMLMKKCTLDNAGQQRIPTQAELQQHTQSIMKQALLRKKIAEQSRYLLEQQQQQNGQEPIPAVQQLIQSICPNVQRSLSVLAAGSGSGQHGAGVVEHHAAAAAGGRSDPGAVGGGAVYAGGNRAPMRAPHRRF